MRPAALGLARRPRSAVLGSVWFLCNRYTPYPNLYPDQSPSEDWTMEERFRPLTFHGLVLRSQLVTLLVRGVCYSESQSVRPCPSAAPVLPLVTGGVGSPVLCSRVSRWLFTELLYFHFWCKRTVKCVERKTTHPSMSALK